MFKSAFHRVRSPFGLRDNPPRRTYTEKIGPLPCCTKGHGILLPISVDVHQVADVNKLLAENARHSLTQGIRQSNFFRPVKFNCQARSLEPTAGGHSYVRGN